MKDTDDDLERLAKEIMQYLQTHPSAADTADGIAKWWIWRQRITGMVSNVQSALDQLVEQGYLVTRTVAGEVFYKRRDTGSNQADEKKE